MDLEELNSSEATRSVSKPSLKETSFSPQSSFEPVKSQSKLFEIVRDPSRDHLTTLTWSHSVQIRKLYGSWCSIATEVEGAQVSSEEQQKTLLRRGFVNCTARSHIVRAHSKWSLWMYRSKIILATLNSLHRSESKSSTKSRQRVSFDRERLTGALV